jgi:hypothetical protein
MFPLLFLVVLSLLLNRGDFRMLILTLAVGVNILTPLEFISDINIWYTTCISMEVLLILTACKVSTNASLTVVSISVALIWCHIVAWKFTGQQPESVYRTVEPILEYLNILSLSVFSTPILNIIKERTKQWLHLKQ